MTGGLAVGGLVFVASLSVVLGGADGGDGPVPSRMGLPRRSSDRSSQSPGSEGLPRCGRRHRGSPGPRGAGPESRGGGALGVCAGPMTPAMSPAPHPDPERKAGELAAPLVTIPRGVREVLQATAGVAHVDRWLGGAILSLAGETIREGQRARSPTAVERGLRRAIRGAAFASVPALLLLLATLVALEEAATQGALPLEYLLWVGGGIVVCPLGWLVLLPPIVALRVASG